MTPPKPKPTIVFLFSSGWRVIGLCMVIFMIGHALNNIAVAVIHGEQSVIKVSLKP